LGDRPFMATGKVVRDYAPLMKFLESIPEDVRREILPKSEDLLKLKELVREGADARELINSMSKVFSTRLTPYGRQAREALKRAWGIDVSEEYAVEELSRELAGWVIEMGEGLGYLSIHGSKRRRD